MTFSCRKIIFTISHSSFRGMNIILNILDSFQCTITYLTRSARPRHSKVLGFRHLDYFFIKYCHGISFWVCICITIFLLWVLLYANILHCLIFGYGMQFRCYLDLAFIDKPKVVSRSQKSKADDLVFIKITMSLQPALTYPHPSTWRQRQEASYDVTGWSLSLLHVCKVSCVLIIGFLK